MVSFEQLAAAVIKFIETEIIPSMTAGQEILARMAIAWVLDSGTIAVDLIAQNSWAKAFGIVDSKRTSTQTGRLATFAPSLRRRS